MAIHATHGVTTLRAATSRGSHEHYTMVRCASVGTAVVQHATHHHHPPHMSLTLIVDHAVCTSAESSSHHQNPFRFLYPTHSRPLSFFRPLKTSPRLSSLQIVTASSPFFLR
jgi:hypothetical protein